MNVPCGRMYSLNVWFQGDKINVSRCCLKRGDILKTYTYEEWLNADLYNELSPLVNIYKTRNLEKVCSVVVSKNTKECFYDKPIDLQRIELGLEYHCNAKCDFCGAKKFFKVYDCFESTEVKKLPEVYFATLEKLKGANLQILTTELGEPFYFKERMKDFLKSLKINDFSRIDFTTNTINIDDEIISLIKEKSTFMPFHFSISLNASTRKRYLERMGVDNFFHAVETIYKLKNIPNVDLFISSVEDSPEENKKFIEFVKKIGIPYCVIPLN